MDAFCEALDLLGADQVFKPRERSFRELRRLIENGLPGKSVDILISYVPSSGQSEWRALIAGRPAGAKLSLHKSERAGRLAYILALSKEVWGDLKQANAFLLNPHPLLDGKSPLDSVKTEWGARDVEALLRRIQFGLPA